MTPSGVYTTNHGGHYYHALVPIPGTPLARRFPAVPRGRFKDAEEAERVRAACPHAEQMEVVDVRELR